MNGLGVPPWQLETHDLGWWITIPFPWPPAFTPAARTSSRSVKCATYQASGHTASTARGSTRPDLSRFGSTGYWGFPWCGDPLGSWLLQGGMEHPIVPKSWRIDETRGFNHDETETPIKKPNEWWNSVKFGDTINTIHIWEYHSYGNGEYSHYHNSHIDIGSLMIFHHDSFPMQVPADPPPSYRWYEPSKYMDYFCIALLTWWFP